MFKQLHIFFKMYILYQGKERPVQTKFMTAKLRAVLKNEFTESAQCQPACARGRLHAVLANFGFLEKFPKLFRKLNKWTLDSLEMEIFESQKKICDTAQCQPIWIFKNFISDSAQCQPAQCQPAQSHIFRHYLRENEFLRKTI